MNFFTKIIEKPVYVDTLQDFRHPQFWEYRQLDRVWVIETCDEALSRIPWYKYWVKKPWKPVEGIVMWWTWDTYFSEDKEFKKFEKMQLSWTTNDGCIVYKAPGWRVLTKKWELVNAYALKKSHGEFQETFEHMEVMEAKKKKVEQARILYEKALKEVSDELEIWKKLQEKFIKDIIPKK